MILFAILYAVGAICFAGCLFAFDGIWDRPRSFTIALADFIVILFWPIFAILLLLLWAKK